MYSLLYVVLEECGTRAVHVLCSLQSWAAIDQLIGRTTRNSRRLCSNFTFLISLLLLRLPIRQYAAWSSTLITHKHSPKEQNQTKTNRTLMHKAYLLSVPTSRLNSVIIALPSDNMRHELQRWLLINIPRNKENRVVCAINWIGQARWPYRGCNLVRMLEMWFCMSDWYRSRVTGGLDSCWVDQKGCCISQMCDWSGMHKDVPVDSFNRRSRART